MNPTRCERLVRLALVKDKPSVFAAAPDQRGTPLPGKPSEA